MYRDRQWLHEKFIKKSISAPDIASQCGVTPVTIRYWARKFGLQRRRYGSLPLDDGYFERIDTTEKAYWLGFIAADGCVQDKPGKRMLSICLSTKDEKHLMKFQNAIGSRHSIYRTHRQTPFGECRSSQLDLSSKKLATDLQRWGIVPRKSKILRAPIIPSALNSHWVRGYFDGDGSVSLAGRSCPQLCCNVVGTKSVLDFVIRRCPVFGQVKKYNGCYRVNFTGNRKARGFYDYLYNDADVMMDRKHAVFARILKEV